MLLGPDKELKILKQSRLMQVSEFSSMVSSLERFKQDLAVRALTGKKNIRSQQTRDKVFFSVLEKMLLEVSSEPESGRGLAHAAKQQLLALRKVYLWFQSNKHVLVKSDGYFSSARKITEEIYRKQRSGYQKRGKKVSKKSVKFPESLLKNIDGHLEQLRALQEDKLSDDETLGGSSMFAPSPTQDLTSIDSTTTRDKGFYHEDLDFAREIYDHELLGGNKIEHLNRPITAPPRIKPAVSADEAHANVFEERFDSSPTYLLKPSRRARPQSALADVKHELSWAKISPIPLSKLIRKKEQEQAALAQGTSNKKKTIRVVIPSQTTSTPEASRKIQREEITDPERIAKLVRFKQFCLQRSVQQEGNLQRYVDHKHGTMQHFLEFPENATDDVVKNTAKQLQMKSEKGFSQSRTSEMSAYRDLSLEEFLNTDRGAFIEEHGQGHRVKHEFSAVDVTASSYSPRRGSAPASFGISPGDSGLLNAELKQRSSTVPSCRVPHPPPKRLRIVQPRPSRVTLSSVYDLADLTGKRMNAASEQTLSAPQMGWKYPTVPVSLPPCGSDDPKVAGGLYLALQEGETIQHKVLIPFATTEKVVDDEAERFDGNVLEKLETASVLSAPPKTTPRSRPRSARSASNFSSYSPSRPSTRPLPSPRYVTAVTAVYRQYKAGVRSSRNDARSEVTFVDDRWQRSACTSRGMNRPRTAASWVSYPAQSEVSRGTGAASHHSTGTLRDRSVAESMRVRSVTKKRHGEQSASGRSSASSYVAQLRAKQRAGGNLPTFSSRQTTKKKSEHDAQHQQTDVSASAPQLSFVNIVAPMHVPSDLTCTAYAAPGGVYCGTTAAVAIATDKRQTDFSDDVLSLEDYNSIPHDRASASDSDAEQENWLSQWLTGGPLEGLQQSSGGVDPGTTYADLVSRAAIVDSCDERSYSEGGASSDAALAAVGSSQDDAFPSGTPRSGPLLSNRTDDAFVGTREPDLIEVEDNAQESASSRAEADEDAASQSRGSENSSKGKEVGEDQADNSEGVASERVEKDRRKGSMVDISERVVEGGDGPAEGKEGSDVISDESDERSSDSSSSIQGEGYEKEIMASDPVQSTRDSEVTKPSSKGEESTVSESIDAKIEDDGELGKISVSVPEDAIGTDRTGTDITEATQAEYEQVERDQKCAREESETSLSNASHQKDSIASVVSETFSKEEPPFANEGATGSESIAVPPVKEDVSAGRDEALEEHQESPERKSDASESLETFNEKSPFRCSSEDDKSETLSARSSVGTLTESESEITADGCDIKIVITSAGKVERLLKAAQEKQESEANAETSGKMSREGSEPQTIPSPEVSASGAATVDGSNPADTGSEDAEAFSQEDMASKNERMSPGCCGEGTSNGAISAEVQRETEADGAAEISDHSSAPQDPSTNSDNGSRPCCERSRRSREISSRTDDDHGIITYEEVADLSRPASGRPIPVEAEVCDPFVEMVASTRQRQIARGVDVQTIFRGNVSGNAAKKFDLDERRRREVEREAVVKMQRAYRRHLFRVSAARTSSRLNPELIEWARSYKASLKEKSERRKQRLRDATSRTRSTERHNKQRIRSIGPHCGVYETFHPEPDLPDREVIIDAAVEIQRHVRGWLVRKELRRVQHQIASTTVENNLWCGNIQSRMINYLEIGQRALNKILRYLADVAGMGLSLVPVVREYRDLLRRTQVRHGRLQPSLELTYQELESYLAQKKNEAQQLTWDPPKRTHLGPAAPRVSHDEFSLLFAKREFWNEMESSELVAFFNDCALYPAPEAVEEAWDAVRKGRDLDRKRKKMRSKTAMSLDDVLEVAFYMFVPRGARMSGDETR